MSRFEKISLALLILVAVILWAAVGWDFYQNAWQMPLGPRLALPTHPIPATIVSQTATTSTGLQWPAMTLAPRTTSTATSANTTLCGGPKTITLLAIGSDTRSRGYLYGLADVIRYVRIDFVTPQISVLEFPRDLWVEIPEIAEHEGITHGKLNQAYLYGNPGMGYYSGPGQGPGLLARTLDLNFGARADHYIAANMYTFVRLVNVIGGIDIDLPFAVDARKPDQPKRFDLYFAPGPHHLSGEQALMLGRIREYSVFARADQQNRVMCAVRDALLNPYNLTRLPEIIDTFDGAVQTDLSPQQISQLACLIPILAPENIIFTTFPRELLTEARTYDIGVKKDVYIFKADFNTLRVFVKSFESGTWPDPNLPAESVATSRPRGEGSSTCP